jgi:hypothetical protein
MRPLLLLPCVALALGACGGNSDTPSPSPPASAVAPGISDEEAVKMHSSKPLRVNGTLFVLKSEVLLCGAVAESYPPQCVGDRLVVQGLELSQVKGLNSAGDVSWKDEPVQLLGVVADGTLTVSENAQA